MLNMKEYTLADVIRDMGQDLIDRADEIAGKEDSLCTRIYITIDIPTALSEVPELSVEHHYVSRNMVERLNRPNG